MGQYRRGDTILTAEKTVRRLRQLSTSDWRNKLRAQNDWLPGQSGKKVSSWLLPFPSEGVSIEERKGLPGCFCITGTTLVSVEYTYRDF